jgi:F0F1-type ATP synthase membrane subunit c/vacuolar-type H+-ATPase subunit K
LRRGSAHPREGKKGEMESLKKAYRTSAIVCAGMIASLFIYAIVVEVINAQHRPFASFPEIQMLRYIFYGLALLQIAVMRLLQRLLLKKTPSGDLQVLAARLSTSAIVISALCETPAIYGLVLFLLAGLYKDFYFLLAYSLGLLLFNFPRYSRWEEWAGRSSEMGGRSPLQ